MTKLFGTVFTERMGELALFDRDTFIALWVKAGSDLTNNELAQLRWEFIHDRHEGGWKINAPIGLRETTVEAILVPRAAEEISKFRKPSGPVFSNRGWEEDLRMFPQIFPWCDREALRAALAPPEAHRAKRRFKPRGPAKEKEKVLEVAVSAPVVEPEPVKIPDVAAIRAAALADFHRTSAELDEERPAVAPQLPHDAPQAKQGSTWPFRKDQCYASIRKVADFLDLSVKTVRTRIDDGYLRATNGGEIKIELASLRQYVQSIRIDAGWKGGR